MGSASQECIGYIQRNHIKPTACCSGKGEAERYTLPPLFLHPATGGQRSIERVGRLS